MVSSINDSYSITLFASAFVCSRAQWPSRCRSSWWIQRWSKEIRVPRKRMGEEVREPSYKRRKDKKINVNGLHKIAMLRGFDKARIRWIESSRIIIEMMNLRNRISLIKIQSIRVAGRDIKLFGNSLIKKYQIEIENIKF